MKRLILLTATAVLSLAPSAPAQQAYPPDVGDAAALVDSWYQRFLGRTARTDRGSNSWITQLVNGSSPDQVLAGILSSDEYYGKGASRPEAFVNNLFQDVLGRRPTQREYDYWVRRAYAQNAEDMKTRQDIAYDLLTHNPGSWRTAPGAPPPTPVPPPRDRYDYDRDRYDYRRPYYPYRR
jgi:hypothetical protein